MKQTTIRTVLLGSATIMAAGAVLPAQAATDGVPIQAIVLTPVAITQTRTLNFGSLTESGAGGTLQVDNTDTGTPGGGVTSVGGTVQAGGFQLKATTGAVVTIQVPSKATITETVGGTAKMTVNAFTIDGGGTKATHTMAGATDTGFRVGGTLNVGGGQLAGTYTGTVTVTANYN